MTAPTDLGAFRALFPALQRLVYLNTATSPPAARPVAEAIRRAVREWETGEFSWQAWEREAQASRSLFADLVGGAPSEVALMSSVAEAASTVAAALPSGRVVVGEGEFQSNLLPWTKVRDAGGDVVLVPEEDGVLRGERVGEAVDASTVLVAVSAVQSSTGVRPDLEPIAARARAVGARVFLNLTQSLGAVPFDVGELEPDFVVAHGYKWLLGPRGAAWLRVRPDRLGELRPLLPNWHSFEDPYADYYGMDELAPDARRLDTSYSWFPWVGARAALEVIASLDAAAVEARCLSLAAAFRTEAMRRGFHLVGEELPSQIVSVDIADPRALKERLTASRVIAAVRGGRLRLGFHAYNDEDDVEAALRALGEPA